VKRVFVATLQVVLDADGAAAASDLLSETLRNADGILDWAYLQQGGQGLYPTEHFVSEPYEEGDFLL
jgi:hypothetical protein